MQEIEFYDVKHRKKVKLPVGNCYTEVIETSKGLRKRIVGIIRENPQKDRELSKFCSMDFEL